MDSLSSCKTLFLNCMINPIVSVSNSKVKELVKLRESARKRRELKRFVIEGYPDLKCILDAGRVIEEIFFCSEMVERSNLLEELEELENRKLLLTELDRGPYEKASYRKNSDGFIGVASTWALSLKASVKEETKICIVLDEIEKPGNLGAIIRTAEAFGVRSILLSDSVIDCFNPNVVRSSRGLLGAINIGMGDKEEVNSCLLANQFSLVATSGNAEISFWDQEFNQKTAFIFGSEKQGLGKFWRDHSADLIKIPMKGGADSLNLHASAACVLAEYNRRDRD